MTTTQTTTVSARELATLIKHGREIDLIDVTTPAEFEALHVAGARSIPLDELDPVEATSDRTDREGARIYLICRSGARSSQAAERFHKAGFTHAVSIEGGTQACRNAGLPVEEGRQTISLERQVRIAAGATAFIGTVLGAFVDPAFLIVPAFVGAGLFFAGVTNNCGMALLLTRMPWNRRKTCCSK